MTSADSTQTNSEHSQLSSEVLSLLEEAYQLGLTDDDLEETADTIQAQAKQLEYAADVVAWAEENYYIEETEQPIILLPHQKAILRFFTQRDENGFFRYNTWMYSTRKKSGKTTIAGILGRWAAETWGKYNEVLCVGNDAKQAQERAYFSAKKSIQMTPGYANGRDVLPGRWRVRTKEMTNLANASALKAVATDYKGEAGANPAMIIWTELWGFIHTDALRFWAEMSPSPTKPYSITLIETYAGYDGESDLLWQQYEAGVIGGNVRQITAGELGDLNAFEEAPNPDSPVPIYVNEAARMVTYWDSGPQSARMPWQVGERGRQYYDSEKSRQTPQQMDRLHANLWISAESAFLESMEQWDRLVNPLPLVPGDRTPVGVALDAGVNGDCFAIVVSSRDPERQGTDTPGVVMRYCYVWIPEHGRPIDFAEPERVCKYLAETYNVVQFAYDPYQLHDMATRLQRQGIGWFYAFNQGQDRLFADKNFYDLIVQGRYRHDGNPTAREHIANANKKQSPTEDTKLRIVKKTESKKIDIAVAASMGAYEILRLNL